MRGRRVETGGLGDVHLEAGVAVDLLGVHLIDVLLQDGFRYHARHRLQKRHQRDEEQTALLAGDRSTLL